ncbi:MAG: LytR/AlgR family response regulator transcription factor [Thermoanaerobaculia bacterium]
MTEPVRVLVVDDEEPARALLAELLSRAPGVEVVGECANGFEAVRAASERRPDAVFLDIQMPKLDGFEVMELLDPAIGVVFVTAYDHYAVKAFEVEAVDYVLKPYREQRLLDALKRARERARLKQRADPARLAAALRPQGSWVGRIAVKDGSGVRVIPVEKLDYAEARDDAIALKAEGKTYLKAQTLSSLAASLDPERFLRVHRSYLLNVDRLRRVELYSKNSHVAILADGTRIPVSREGHARLRIVLGDGG